MERDGLWEAWAKTGLLYPLGSGVSFWEEGDLTPTKHNWGGTSWGTLQSPISYLGGGEEIDNG